MASLKQRFWPTIDDEESANLAVRGAFTWSVTWAFLNLSLGLISLSSGSAIADSYDARLIFDCYSIIDGAIFGLIAWKIRSMSKGWAIAGLAVTSFGVLASLSVAPSPFLLVGHSLVLLSFVNAVRAAVVVKRLKTVQSSGMGDAEKLLQRAD
jgi:hypothetical protein